MQMNCAGLSEASYNRKKLIEDDESLCEERRAIDVSFVTTKLIPRNNSGT